MGIHGQSGEEGPLYIFMEVSAQGVVLGSGMLAFVMSFHMYPAALPVLAVAPQLRLWLMSQSTLLPSILSPC